MNYADDDIQLSDDFWDCDCDKNYHHKNEIEFCFFCDAYRDTHPNSIVSELEENGYVHEPSNPFNEPFSSVHEQKSLSSEQGRVSSEQGGLI